MPCMSTKKEYVQLKHVYREHMLRNDRRRFPDRETPQDVDGRLSITLPSARQRRSFRYGPYCSYHYLKAHFLCSPSDLIFILKAMLRDICQRGTSIGTCLRRWNIKKLPSDFRPSCTKCMLLTLCRTWRHDCTW